ncbi:hypothetical protein FDP41_001726 [Naegleria fowleri]|uniref:Arf-GAP domain-containing protein n=1 Tax=Naegleria fowleri TaxID=5763 RepID=A0A6A5BN01_NAEFO|nr:uncharacterized protein FDP41_001726 [Naegleria fowleri]KAF0979383.1 hypothetical protein FDP41_001726 [Naegleria fowleri]CAG4710977.1 unnamed protein product [Naegleria fowleri]
MASKGENNSRNKKIVADLLKLPGNKVCADCNARGPQWASTTQGVFVCIRCAGLHRKLGTHISKVRSVGLDSWNDEQTRMVELFGNEKANAIYEAKLDKEKPNPDTDTATVEKFIRAKYERKIWIDKEEEARQYGNLKLGNDSEESSPATTPSTPLRTSASTQNFASKTPSTSNLRSVSSQDEVSSMANSNSNSRNNISNASKTPTPKIQPSTSTPSLISFDDNKDDLQQFVIRDNVTSQNSNNTPVVSGKDSVLAMFESPPVQPLRNGPPQNPNQPLIIPGGPPPLNNNNGIRMPPPINNGVRPTGPPPYMMPPMGRGYPPTTGSPLMNGPPPLNNNGFMNGPPPPMNGGFMNGPPPLNNGNFMMNGPPPMMGRGYPTQPTFNNHNNGMRY